MIGGAVSDETGSFGLEARPGRYFLKITYVSYEDKIIPSVLVTNQNIGPGAIRLHTNSRVLDEVVVTGEKSQMELQLDERIFNVAKYLSNIGSNASEILNNLPSVNRGSQNVRILIDGKQSGLVGISGTDALRQLQGNMIESIEVITNPSSRYDAEGEVGIINIVLKKERKNGLNGSYMATLGVPSNYGGSFNMNYRKNKINLIGNYSVNYRANPGGGNSRQEYISSDTSFVYEQNRRRTRSGLGHSYQTKQSVDLSKLVQDDLVMFEELIQIKSITLKTELAEQVRVIINPAMADILLINLLNNAIRHNKEDGAMGINLTSARLIIEHTGLPLQVPTELLFQRFKKNNQSSDSIGLGLAIVKQICDLNHFDIQYRYEEPWHRLVVDFYPVR